MGWAMDCLLSHSDSDYDYDIGGKAMTKQRLEPLSMDGKSHLKHPYSGSHLKKLSHTRTAWLRETMVNSHYSIAEILEAAYEQGAVDMAYAVNDKLEETE